MDVKFDKSKKISSLLTLAKPLTPLDINNAVVKFNAANGNIHSYSDSTGYDLLIDNNRYPPKALFGIAMSKLLDIEVLSSHFSGGVDSPCFKTLERLGFEIVTKPRPSKEDGLVLYQSYTREQLNSIFDPEIIYSKGAGRWGGTGIVPNAPIENDFAFIVTLEDKKKYEDYLTKDGFIFWKSQEQHTPNSSWIKSFCVHDENVNTIYLFMRVKDTDAYTFFGPLAFKDWDPTTSEPVHFQWRLLNWPLPNSIYEEFKVHIRAAVSPSYEALKVSGVTLTEVDPPKAKKGTNKAKKSSNKGLVDWAKREQNNRELGLAGEQIVVEAEKARLRAAGFNDLAEQVEHIAMVDSAAGYDIKSFDQNGNFKFIEVKTTTGSKSSPFYISRNEVEVSKELGDHYWIYRVYDFDYSSTEAKFYSLNGAVEFNFKLVAESYKATVK